MTVEPFHSCLYECTVMHRRLAPKVHAFQYRIFMFAFDLDELDTLPTRVLGFSRNRRNVYQFRDTDHLGATVGTVKENLAAYLASQGITLPEGARTVLLTLPRVLGYIFNPVSFYFCTDAAGQPLCAVTQVGNTFGEQKLYLLPQAGVDRTFRLRTPKHFYVSPFLDLATEFEFKLRLPADSLEIHIDDHEGGERVLLSALTGRRVPLTSGRLAWLTLKYPLITVKVIFLIHWHALLLFAKRIPWFAKAAQPELQRGVLRPHSSLASRSL
jgi:hypothetical protein